MRALSKNDDAVATTVILNADLRPLGVSSGLLIMENGRFIQVLDMRDRDQVSLSGARVVDAGGRTMLPGIDDSHLHGYEYGRSLTAHDFRGSADLQDFQRRLAYARPEGSGWIRGIGWDDSNVRGTGPRGTVCAADLDVSQPRSSAT